MLVFCCCFGAATANGQNWVGVLSENPSEPTISTSYNKTNFTGVSIDIPGFYFAERQYKGKTLSCAQLQGGHPILVSGIPELEKISFSIQLPADGNLEVIVESFKYTEYQNIEIVPSSGNIEKNSANIEPEMNEVYNTNSFYPGKMIDSEQPYIVRNKRAQAFQVYPLQYNPVTKVLRFYSNIVFKLIHTEGSGINPLTQSDLGIYPIEGIEPPCQLLSTQDYKSGALPADRGSMLVICPENFRDAILPLVDWKIETGIETEIVNAEQFSNSEEIYNYIKTYYYNHQNLAYLLLVGDGKQIPSYTLPYGASDNQYSYLAGNDHYPDILVGRFSAESIIDVEIQVNKTLQYEKNIGSNSPWLTNATGIASVLGPGDDGESDYQHIRNLLNKLKTTSYTSVNEFFDGSQGGIDTEGNPSTSSIVDKINNGTGIIFYAGHGTPKILATGSLTNDVISNLNNVGKFPVIWSAACEAGNFTNKFCNAEAWMRASNSKGQACGAVASHMASGSQTSFPPMQAQDKIAEILSNPSENLSTLGAVSVTGMMSMNDTYGNAGFATTDTWILFGDPSLRIRTAQPKQLKIEHSGKIGYGRTIYKAKCNSESGFACLSYNGSILGKGPVINGIITLFLDRPADGEFMTLTVTALNCLPVIEKIEVIKTPGLVEFCSPVNHSKTQPISTELKWEAGEGGDPEYYLVYLGTNNPPSNILNGVKVSSTSYKPQLNLDYSKDYYWRVVSVNSYGSNEGKVMTFNTVFKPDEDFESEQKNSKYWIDGGISNWDIDQNNYFDGSKSIKSGQINNNQHSSIIFPIEVKNCDFVSFWSKTSCEPGDKLQFLVNGNLYGEWGGESDWTFHIYKIEPGNHQLEWRYNKDNSSTAGEDAVWLDNLHLPVHLPATVDINENGAVCRDAGFEAIVSAEHYFSMQWETEGDGNFSDYNASSTLYKPGSIESENKTAKLHLKVKGFDGCPVISKTIHLDIHPLPVITLPSDTLISEGSTIMLDATIQGINTYEWKPFGSTDAQIIIDSVSAVNHSKAATLTVTNEQGCTSSKTITVHFNNSSTIDEYKIYPNPSNGNFTLQPLKGSSVIEKMKLVDREGRIVWTNTGTTTIIGSKDFSIKSVASGEYFLINENKQGQSVNTIVIR